MPQIPNRNHRHILIVQTAFLGDVILITPLIHATKSLFPMSKIDALILPQTAAALANNPDIEHLLLFDKRANKMRSFFRLIREIHKNKYDLVLTPHSSMTTALLLFLSRIKTRVGYNRWAARHLLTHKVPHPDDGMHKIDKNLGLLSVFGTQKYSRQTALYPSDDDIGKAGILLSPLLNHNKPLIALAPGSVWFTKRWPQAYYSKLINLLAAQDFALVLIGAPDEKDLCTRVIEKSGREALNLAGELSILESAAVIKQCDLLICNDSGAMHIGNAMQTDVFAFFGPTVLTIGYYPYRSDDTVFELDMDCRPCGSHGSNNCPLGHHDCMNNILPGMVFDAVQRKFK